MSFFRQHRTIITALLAQFSIGFLLYLFDDGGVAGVGGYPLTVTLGWWVYCLLCWGNIFTVFSTWKLLTSGGQKVVSALLSLASILIVAATPYGVAAPIAYQLHYLGRVKVSRSILLGVLLGASVFVASAACESIFEKNTARTEVQEFKMSPGDSAFVSKLFIEVFTGQSEIAEKDHSRFLTLLKMYPKQLSKPDVSSAAKLQATIYRDLDSSLSCGLLIESNARKEQEAEGENKRNNDFILSVMRGDTLTAPDGSRIILTRDVVKTILSGLDSAMKTREVRINDLYSPTKEILP